MQPLSNLTDTQSDLIELPPSQRLGKYEVRFAETLEEIEAAQALRYRVFYQEKHGQPTDEMKHTGLAADQWDEHALIVIVIDHSADHLSVVGTLRLSHKQQLPPGEKLYTEDYFDLSRLSHRYSNMMELSRACIDSKGRGGSILLLIWKFTMSYLVTQKIDVMVGCASFPGTDLDAHRAILGFLHHRHRSPEELMPQAITPDAVYLPDLQLEDGDWQEAQHSIPTLLRGYLKLGAHISDHLIIDPQFNTLFVAIYVETKTMLQQNSVLVVR